MTEPWNPDELAELEDLTAAAMQRDAVADPSLVGATYGRTDWDNARRLALYEAANLRYVNEVDAWYKWCGTNWCEASSGDRFGIAARVALRISQEEVVHIEDDDERGRHAQWGQQSLSETKLRAMVNVAGGISDLHIAGDAFDNTPLLNLPNCTIDPLTLEWHAHRREDLITQLCPTPYQADATSRRLDDFIERFLPDEKERDYLLQVLATSALSHGNTARNLVLLLGPTSTGKSTLMELVQKTLGRGYTAAVNPSVFRGNLEDKPRPDLLRALKTRLILAFEASERWELHPDQIKRMTGGDPITARGMRSNAMNEAIAPFVPIIIANTMPQIHGADDALRRRLLALLMDTPVAEDEDDGTLRHRLVNDENSRRALLALLVRIYHDCQGRVTLPIPQRFAELTMEIFAALDDVDEVLKWLKEDGSLYQASADVATSHYVPVSTLYRCYSIHVEQHGTSQMKREKLGLKQFHQRLLSLGYEVIRSNGSRVVGWCLGDTRITNMARF